MPGEVFDSRHFGPRQSGRAQPLVRRGQQLLRRGKAPTGVERFDSSENRGCCRAVELLVGDRFNQRPEWAPVVPRLERAGPDFLDEPPQNLVAAAEMVKGFAEFSHNSDRVLTVSNR